MAGEETLTRAEWERWQAANLARLDEIARELAQRTWRLERDRDAERETDLVAARRAVQARYDAKRRNRVRVRRST